VLTTSFPNNPEILAKRVSSGKFSCKILVFVSELPAGHKNDESLEGKKSLNTSVKALVTGGTGFVGSHVVDLLLKQGWEVVCPVRDPKNLRNLNGAPVRVIPIDEVKNQARTEPPFAYVIHVAGATRAPDYQAYHEANVNGTRQLLEIFTDLPPASRPKRFVLVGSQAAAGPCPDRDTSVIESHKPNPVSLYGRSKLEAEHVVLSFSKQLPVTVVRPSTVFGPRDLDVLGVFKCARYRFSPYLAGPDRMFSIIYVEDLARGILAATLADVPSGQTYFLANSTPISWREFTLEVARLTGCRTIAVPVPLLVMRLASLAGEAVGKLTRKTKLLRSEKFEEMRQVGWVCSTEKACRELNWEPEVPLSEAIVRTAQWYRKHGWI
jgi:2-alkyl-3-oxoalkanoate reductase